MTKQLGVIGYPLSHTLSPVFQQAALDYHAIPADLLGLADPAGMPQPDRRTSARSGLHGIQHNDPP